MNNFIRTLLLCVSLATLQTAWAGAEVFPLRSSNPEQVLEIMRTALGDRAQVEIVQQKLVIIGDEKTLAEAKKLLPQIDRLPTNLRLTLTENPPTEAIDSKSGVITYSVDKNTQSLETVEGAQVSLEFTKFHQQVEASGWLFTVDEQPVAVQSLEMNVRLIGARTVKVMMSFARYENQQRRVYGRVVTGELGTWIALLPQSSVTISEGDGTGESFRYRSGNKPGEQLYLMVEKIFPARPVKSRRH